MKKAKVTYYMVEEETGGFTTGILRKGKFTENKHQDLIKGIDLLPGFCWSVHIEWLSQF